MKKTSQLKYSLHVIIRVITSGRVRWAGYAVHMGEMQNANQILVGISEGKRPIWRPRQRWN
jgi:hypothetical protein